MFKSNDYLNKETNETQFGKTKLQLQTVRSMQDGSDKIELLDISIPPEKVGMYRSQIGKDVSVDIGLIGKVNYYGI
jgi:hypothetical protein